MAMEMGVMTSISMAAMERSRVIVISTKIRRVSADWVYISIGSFAIAIFVLSP